MTVGWGCQTDHALPTEMTRCLSWKLLCLLRLQICHRLFLLNANFTCILRKKSVQVFLIYLHLNHLCVCVYVCVCVCMWCECGELFNVQELLKMFSFGTCHFRLFIWGVRGYVWLGSSFLQLSQACGRNLLEVSVSRLPKRPSRGSEQQLAASRQLAPGKTSKGALKRVAAYWGHTAVLALQRPGNPAPHLSPAGHQRMRTVCTQWCAQR